MIRERSRAYGESLWPAVRGMTAVGGMLAAGYLVAAPGGLRLMLAGALAFFLIAVGLRRSKVLLFALIPWFVFLGGTRRIVSGASAKEAWGDPLLLVGAGAWVLLALVATHRGAFNRRTSLTFAVLSLAGLLTLSAANPLQGGPTVGLSGALLVVLPMAAFLVGRTVVDDVTFRRLLVLAACLGVVSAVYGLLQTFHGFPSWDEEWIRTHGYASLSVGGSIRAFASFSAASEYAAFLAIAIVVCIAHLRLGGWRRFPAIGLALAILSAGLWYESSRGIVVLTVAAIAMMATARRGMGLGRSLVLAAAALALVPFVVGHLAPARFTDTADDRFSEHQVQGLTDPLGQHSSLTGHIGSVRGAIVGAVDDPIGVGVGSTTISGAKYGGAKRSAEADPGNAAVAAGLPGLVAYGFVLFLGLPRVYRLAARRRDMLSLAALGILLVTFLQWLNGAQYAVAFWPWLVLGWADASVPTAAPGGRELERTSIG